MKNIEEKLKILQKLYRGDLLYPFPHSDCRKILSEKDRDFIPCLDIYFSDIAGYCSWGKKILLWSYKEIAEAKNKLQNSFFQRFPAYSEVSLKINSKNTPQLYNQILIYDLMRLTLIDILSEIEEERIAQSESSPELSFVS
ncbi:MAG: hypothetical protein ACR2IA_12635 [Pyrinomonadaceae bacterium]